MHNYEKTRITQNGDKTANSPAKVAIVGARGYSGLDLLRILLRHPGAQVEACLANESSFNPSTYLPEDAASRVRVLPLAQLKEVAAGVNTVFLATPAEASVELARRSLSAGANVVDLSGAFRLQAEEAQRWYGLSGGALSLLEQAEYGLSPWAGPGKTQKGPRLVSNPGCYATAVLMALLPLLKEGLIDPATLVIDAKSGATGAGKKASEDLLFCEVEGGCLPYKVGAHQHLPEIKQYATHFASTAIDPMFVTHLLSVRRGIIAGLYARVSRKGVSLEQIEAAFSKAYAGYPLVRFGRIDGQRGPLTLRRVVGSARTEIRFELKGDQLYVFSLIDNLLKGAASQAVENFNRLQDYPVTTALIEMEGVL